MNGECTSPQVLITGVSGNGKSGVITMLRYLGYVGIDMDEPGYSFRAESGHQLWNESRLQEALASRSAEPVFVGGCAENQVKFYPQFTHVILLSAPLTVLLARLENRGGDPEAGRQAEREQVRHNLAMLEPLLRLQADVEITTVQPLADIVTEILTHVCPG